MSTRQVVALGGAAFGAMMALNGALSSGDATPRHAMPGKAGEFSWTGGRVHYTVLGSGPPMLLVHGLGVAASSFEYRYVTELLARSFRVFAIDLLGFGQSEHPKISYSAAGYIDLLADFLVQVVRGPAVLVAAGISATYSLAVAQRVPDAVQALVLVMPEHVDGRSELPRVVCRVTDAVFAAPVLGQSLFNLMTARNALRAHLREHAYANPDLVTESMVDAQYAMAHQPNSLRAPHAYLSGHLGMDARAALAAIRQPVLLLVGGRAVPPPWKRIREYVRLSSQARVAVVGNCGALPHEEQPESFCRSILSWRGEHDQTPAS